MVQSHGKINSWCVFDDDQNSWCLLSTGDMLTVGWEVAQTAEKATSTSFGTYSISFKPYLTSAIELVSSLIMDLLINW